MGAMENNPILCECMRIAATICGRECRDSVRMGQLAYGQCKSHYCDKKAIDWPLVFREMPGYEPGKWLSPA